MAKADEIHINAQKTAVSELELVSSFDWIDFEKLADVKELILETFSGEEAAEYLDEARIHAIIYTIENRIRKIRHMAASPVPIQYNSTLDDVEKNTAADYRH